MQSELNSVGLIELSSIAAGYLVEDTALKAADVQLLLARTICSGKFLIAIAGDVTSVQAALQAGNCPIHCCFHAGGCPVLCILNCVVD